MYSYEWDSSTGGYVLTPTPLAFSKEPRPVYYKELDILGFDKHWKYDKNDCFPYMWAEANNYFYRGRLVAKVKGGSCYTAPEIVLVEDPELNGFPLRFVDIPAMVEKNREIIGQLAQDTIKRIYNTFIEHQENVDVFYVAFSGGKDSIVTLDLVQRALPHNSFKVLFGDTGMEFPDTYKTVEEVKKVCSENEIEFLTSKSQYEPGYTWSKFGPPATVHRWCCSVHKTSPQIIVLRNIIGKPNFTGMAFIGVRASESLSRSEYDYVSLGEKHKGQYSCNPILEWNSAELYAYIYLRQLYLNEAYKKGNRRAGCLVCPRAAERNEYMARICYPAQFNALMDKVRDMTGFQQIAELAASAPFCLLIVTHNLCHAIASYQKYDDNKKWLYFIALSISGAKENEYLQMVIDSVSTEKELIKTIFRLILTVDKSNAKFDPLYRQRKDLLGELKDCLSEITEYCKVLATKGENALYYLTDLTILEKERIIAWLNVYGQKYDTLKLISVLKKVYPDLASYLTKFRFKNKLLDDYFDAYKYQKVVNHILPSFETVVDEQATKMDFVTALKPRAAIVEKLDVTNSRAFFLDALGVEYLGFIQEKCSEYGLSADVSCGRCELPSITSQNKEFVATLQSKGCVIADIKDLDDIKHHGEDSFDYEKEKNPIYLIRELEIIDELLKKIQASIFNGSYEKAIIISDHGASRLAVLHETENIWSMATSGEHSGRCCPVNELNSKPNAAIEENGFWVLANYDRFKGGRKANVEVHGGASLEEVAVPIIEITRKQTNIEAFILDSSRVITLAAKEHATPRIYVGVKSNSIGIMLNGQYYDALATSEPYIYSVDLADYTRKGTYTFEILNGNDILASGQKFEIRKMGMSENAGLFDF